MMGVVRNSDEYVLEVRLMNRINVKFLIVPTLRMFVFMNSRFVMGSSAISDVLIECISVWFIVRFVFLVNVICELVSRSCVFLVILL